MAAKCVANVTMMYVACTNGCTVALLHRRRVTEMIVHCAIVTCPELATIISRFGCTSRDVVRFVGRKTMFLWLGMGEQLRDGREQSEAFFLSFCFSGRFFLSISPSHNIIIVRRRSTSKCTIIFDSTSAHHHHLTFFTHISRLMENPTLPSMLTCSMCMFELIYIIRQHKLNRLQGDVSGIGKGH